jgi:outer membrane biogenesis lipoprotein LolB
MRIPLLLPIAMLLLAACTGPGDSAQGNGDRCLYATEAEYGSQLRWDSCSHPPPYSRRVD